MRFKDCIKLGFGAYIGWEIAKAFDHCLAKLVTKYGWWDKIDEFTSILENEEIEK